MPSKKLLRSLIFASQHQSKQKLPTPSCQSCTFSFEYFYASGFLRCWPPNSSSTTYGLDVFWMEWNYFFRKMAQASQRFWLFCFTLSQEAEEWNLLLLQAKRLGESWFFVCFSGPKWHLTGDHCMNNPQLAPHFLRGSNDARSYPKKTSICQRWFKFTQKFQGIQKSNIFARKSIVVVFFPDAFWSKQSKRMACLLEVQQRLTKTEVVSTVASQELRKARVFPQKKEDKNADASILVSTSGIFRRCSLCFRFQKTLDVMDVIKLTLRFKFKSVFLLLVYPSHVTLTSSLLPPNFRMGSS